MSQKHKPVFLFILLCVALGIGAKKFLAYNHEKSISAVVQEYSYVALVGQQLQSEWDCLSDSDDAKEQFLLKLMNRFAPDDLGQLERGKLWIRDYRMKQLAGKLTVEERNQARAHLKPVKHGGTDIYVHPWPMVDGMGAMASSKSLMLDTCALDDSASCPDTRSFTNLGDGNAQITYETQGLRWHVAGRQWPDLVRQEYHKLKDADERLAELEEMEKQDESLRYEARQHVAKMSAEEVPSYMEEKTIAREYLKLKCR